MGRRKNAGHASADGWTKVAGGKFLVRFNAPPYNPRQSSGKGDGKGFASGIPKGTAQRNNSNNQHKQQSKKFAGHGNAPWVPCTNARCKGHQGAASFKYVHLIGSGQNGQYCMGCGQNWNKSLKQALEQGMLPAHLVKEVEHGTPK